MSGDSTATRSQKQEHLLAQAYAEACPKCGAVVFEWWESCRTCSGNESNQTTLTAGGFR